MIARTVHSAVALFALVALPAIPVFAQTYLRVQTSEVAEVGTGCDALGPARPRPLAGAASALDVLAFSGQVLEDGGTLSPVAFVNPATLNRQTAIAFFAQVDGVDRNQGIFVADASGVHTVVRGCGGAGGSGDPGGACGDRAPGGGTFTGFYAGTFFAPAINDRGDVLFFADVYQDGETVRGLHLYLAPSRKIVKVARIGDASPRGNGRLVAVGPGSLNNGREVAFLAQGERSAPGGIDIVRWHDGAVKKVAAVGDPAPGGGTFSMLGTETVTFANGVTIPVGPLPGINDRDQISFRVNVTGGVTEQGLIVSTKGVNQWYVKAGDVTPAGGTYVDFWAPVLNNASQIAFVGDFAPAPGSASSAWFTGSPQGGWRKALGFCDPVGDGQAIGLAVSRNPMRPLDEDGDLVMWSEVETPAAGMVETLVVSTADGILSVIASAGEATPLGGQIGNIQTWPSLRAGRGTVSASTPGAAGGVTSAHMVSTDAP